MSRICFLGRYYLIPLAALLFLLSCAGGEAPTHPVNQDQGDVGVDTDSSEPEDADDIDADSADDDVEEDDPCPVCCPGTVRCGNSTTVETCRADGTGYIPTSCASGEVCSGGACNVDQVCTPGEKYCHSNAALQFCRPDGGGYLTENCPTDTVCVVDECLSGQRSGEICQSGDDCAGGLCRCGDDETCALAQQPYCASDCSANTCPSNEVCWLSDGVAAASYDHCLRGCNGICDITGLDCTEVQTEVDGVLQWQGACLPPQLKPVGSRCDSDAECVNGQCSSEIFGFGVCTQRCEDTGCPSGTACVKLASSDIFWCSPRCTDGGSYCPLKESPQDWSVDCQARLIHGGGNARVCTT